MVRVLRAEKDTAGSDRMRCTRTSQRFNKYRTRSSIGLTLFRCEVRSVLSNAPVRAARARRRQLKALAGKQHPLRGEASSARFCPVASGAIRADSARPQVGHTEVFSELRCARARIFCRPRRQRRPLRSFEEVASNRSGWSSVGDVARSLVREHTGDSLSLLWRLNFTLSRVAANRCAGGRCCLSAAGRPGRQVGARRARVERERASGGGGGGARSEIPHSLWGKNLGIIRSARFASHA